MPDEVAKFMAELFDVDVDVEEKNGSSNGDIFLEDDDRSFEQKSKDLELITVSEEEVKEDIVKEDVVKEEPKEEPKEEIEKESPSPKNETIDILEEADKDPIFDESPENPLGLDQQDLASYKMLQEKYADRFTLYDGNIMMKQFYRYKVRQLGYLLSKYPFLYCDSLADEIQRIDVHHSIRGMPHGDIIAKKLNDITRERERLTEIAMQLHRQYYVWEACLEMMKGKLWCVKEVKGQHKREGIVADHMNDVVHYVTDLKSVLNMSRHIDVLLIASAESLSRQLSCIQEKKNREGYVDPQEDKSQTYNSIEEGTEIKDSPPVEMEATGNLEFGLGKDQLDELSNIG